MNGDDDFWTSEELQIRLERLVVSFEKIAEALGGLHEEAKRAGTRYWPQPGPQRETIVSHALTEEEKIKERQGYGKSVQEWLTNFGDHDEEEGVVGDRSRQWAKDHPTEKSKAPDASAETASVGKPDPEGAEKAESKT
jgi:hypothetical protein